MLRLFSFAGLVILILAGCAGREPGSSSMYDPATKTQIEKSPNPRLCKPSFFLLDPNTQTWHAYYELFRLRKLVLEELPHFVPEDENEIPVVLNDKVLGFIEYFQTRGRESFSKWLSRSGKYIPAMKEILEDQGMPADLVYLAMIESGFNVRARSHKGAVGPWQFIASTGRRYGLRIDSWVDERMDPEKSTVAAANYLRDLYDMFQSWELAAAGYNAGEMRVQSAIEKYKVSDFWEISEHTLPRETKDYVPKLMAALIIARNLEKYGFTGIEYQRPEPFETAYVPPQRSLAAIAEIIGVSDKRLKDLNSSLIKGATPPGGSYEIRVPSGLSSVIAEKKADITALEEVKIVTVSKPKYTRYTVRRGDSLGKIASRYGVSVSAIKRANRLKGSNIRVGQTLVIPGRGSVSTYVATTKSDKKTTVQTVSSTNKHKVSKGESLGKIASRYGVTVASLKRANNIKGSTIRPGQELKIPDRRTLAKSSDDRDLVTYRVRRGDTLSNIAGKYDVSITDIKKWNNLKSSRVVAGDKLRIYQ